jgi:hypothetical protein
LRESIIITAVKSKIGMNYYHASLPSHGIIYKDHQ